MWTASQPDTQNVTDDIYSQENEDPKIWGRLYSVRAKIKSLGKLSIYYLKFWL